MSMTNANFGQQLNPNAGPQDAAGGLDADVAVQTKDQTLATPKPSAPTWDHCDIPNSKNETPGVVTPVAVMPNALKQGGSKTGFDPFK